MEHTIASKEDEEVKFDRDEQRFLNLLRSNPSQPYKKRKFGEAPMPEVVFEKTLPGFLATCIENHQEPCDEDLLVKEAGKIFDSLRKLSGNRYKGAVRHTVLTCLRTLQETFKLTDEGWDFVSPESFEDLRRQTVKSLKKRYLKEEKVIVNDEVEVDSRSKDKFIKMTMRFLKKLKQDPEIVEQLTNPLKVRPPQPFSQADKIEDLRGAMDPERFSGLLQGYNLFRNRCKD